jgi:hypothetical protein
VAHYGAAAPSLLVGEGRGGGSCRGARWVPHRPTPTPDPSPQGGGEKKHRSAMSELPRVLPLLRVATLGP